MKVPSLGKIGDGFSKVGKNKATRYGTKHEKTFAPAGGHFGGRGDGCGTRRPTAR
jgi:hypothetical protein